MMENQTNKISPRQITRYVLLALGLLLIPLIILHIKSFLMLLLLLLALVVAVYAAFKISMVLIGIAALLAGFVLLLSAAGWLIHFFG